MNSIVLVFYYCIGKKQHILASLRKAEQNIFVPPGLARGFLKSFLRVPTVIVSNSLEYMIETVRKRHPKTFCLNSLRHEESEAAKIFMQKKFPNAAPWEG